jgi:hypothetical protein
MFLHSRGEYQGGHGRIMIMRPKTILRYRPDRFSQTASYKRILAFGRRPYIFGSTAVADGIIPGPPKTQELRGFSAILGKP